MIDYRSQVTIEKVNVLNNQFKPANKTNFIKVNDIQTLLALVGNFLYFVKETDKISNIKNNLKYFIEDDDIVILNTGLFKCKMYQSDSHILCLFINDNHKLTKTNFTSYVVSLYRIINTIFVRAKLTFLDIIPENNTYVIAFTVEHGPEITISIRDILDTYRTVLTTDFYNKKFETITQNLSEKDIQDEEKFFDEDSANMTSFFDMNSTLIDVLKE